MGRGRCAARERFLGVLKAPEPPGAQNSMGNEPGSRQWGMPWECPVGSTGGRQGKHGGTSSLAAKPTTNLPRKGRKKTPGIHRELLELPQTHRSAQGTGTGDILNSPAQARAGAGPGHPPSPKKPSPRCLLVSAPPSQCETQSSEQTEGQQEVGKDQRRSQW